MPNYELINARQTMSGAKKFTNIKNHEASGDSPSQAARKMLTSVCESKKIKGRCALKLTVKQKGKDKLYKYHGVRKFIKPKDRLNTGIKKADGSALTFKYSPSVKRLYDSKTSSAPTVMKKKSTTPSKASKKVKAKSVPTKTKKSSNSWLNRVFGS